MSQSGDQGSGERPPRGGTGVRLVAAATVVALAMLIVLGKGALRRTADSLQWLVQGPTGQEVSTQTPGSPSFLATPDTLSAAAPTASAATAAPLVLSAINPADPPEVQLDEALAQKQVTFVLFHSTTCIPCKEMEKVAADVMPEYRDRVIFVDAKVNDPANSNLVRRMQVLLIPTTYIIDHSGQSRVFQGVISRDALRAELDAALDG